jgi:hypothetical protein
LDRSNARSRLQANRNAQHSYAISLLEKNRSFTRLLRSDPPCSLLQKKDSISCCHRLHLLGLSVLALARSRP